MKAALVVGLIWGSTLTVHAVAPHPTVLTVKYKEEMLPVVRMDDLKPVVEIGGKEKVIRARPEYAMARAGHFHVGEIEFIRLVPETAKGRIGSEFINASSIGNTDFLEMKLKSSVSLKHVFIVIVGFSFDLETLQFKDSEETITPHAAPDLVAGQEAAFRYVSPTNAQFFFSAQVFSEGVEVHSNLSDGAAKHYSRLEKAKLSALLANLKIGNAGKDVPLFPIVKVKPFMPEGAPFPATDAKALFTVTADGLVTDVEIKGTLDPVAEKAVRDALEGWLFLPRFKAGQPVATRIALPLVF